MKLSELHPDKGATRRPKRLGRGIGSGVGKTSGKGHKGQKARSGGGTRPGFEGGQMPLQRRLPKRGFRHEKKAPFQIVNIAAFAEMAGKDVITPTWLKEHGLIRTLRLPVKVLAEGDLSAAVSVQAQAFSEAARSKIEAAGGTAEVI